jgi:hypothetical protein
MGARKQPKLRPNALKHGTFSDSAVLPLEDPRAFEVLFQSLIKEWQPSGTTERATVLELARCLWRVQRLDIFVEAERGKARACLPGEMFKLIEIMAKHKDNNEEFVKQILIAADGDLSSYHAFDKVSGLLEGSDIWKGLDFGSYLKDEFDALGLGEKRIPWLRSTMRQATLEEKFGDVVSRERFEKEQALRERLESMIDRCIRRLMQLKVGKRTLGLEPLESPPDRVPRLKVVN